jgi:prophage DNA circulation protein
MAWYDNLYLDGKGSFRGVEFFVQNVETAIGRRTVLHEFPAKDKPFVEDLGRKARQINIEAYFVGPDYMAGRDDLRREIEDNPGKGILVHPFWGELQVTVIGDVRIRETPAEGGVARVSFTVIEAGDELPTIEPNKAAALVTKANEADAATKDSFEETFDVVGYAAYVAEAAVNTVTAITSEINSINGRVNSVMAIADQFGSAIDALDDAAADLVETPGALVDAMADIVGGIVESVGSLGSAWDDYFDTNEQPGDIAGTPATAPSSSTPASCDKRADIMLKTHIDIARIGDSEYIAAAQFDADGEPLPEEYASKVTLDPAFEEVPYIPSTAGTANPRRTTQREQEATNQAALLALNKTLATTAACRAVTEIPIGSANKADEIQTSILAILDELIDAADDTTFGPLTDLRVALVTYLQSASAALPRIVEFIPSTTLPALVIAQQLYGSVELETDIIARNSIRYPSRVPGGQAIEVLSYD